MADRRNTLMLVLVLVIVVLAGILIFTLLVRPAISGYSIEKQQEGVQIAVNSILLQLQQQGFVQIPIGNQTLILVPYQPQQTEPQQTQTSGQ